MKKILSIIALFSVSVCAGAQALPFIAADFDPAILAKGGVDFSNPAAMAFYDGTVDSSVGYTMWQPEHMNLKITSLEVACKIGDKTGIVSKLSYGSYPEYMITDEAGMQNGKFQPSYLQFGVGGAYKIIPWLSVGANVGYIVEKLSNDASYSALGGDIHAMIKIGNISATAGISNIGGKISDKSGNVFKLPSAADIGLGYSLSATESHRVDMNADAHYYFSGDIAVAAGVSYTYSNMITVRSGYRYGGRSVIPSFASAGVGIKIYGIKLDFAYLFASDVMKNTMSISIGYGF